MEQVQNRVESIVAKCIQNKLDSKEMERIITNRISDIVINGFKDNDNWYRNSFDDLIIAKTRAIVEERLNKEYKLEVRMIEKDKKTIHSVKRTKKT